MSKELLNQEQKELPHPKCEFKVQNNSSLSKLKENKKQSFMKSDNLKSQQCANCKKLTQKIKKLAVVAEYVTYVKNQNSELKEQIQFLTQNFKYILELASQNISNGVKSRTKKILAEKQNLIQNQKKIIQRLQKQSQILMENADHNNQYSEKIENMEKRIKQLQAQNFQLKFLKQNSKIQRFKQSPHLADSTNNSQNQTNFVEIPSLRNKSSQQELKIENIKKPAFLVKKMISLDIENLKQLQTGQASAKKSLNDIRLKVSKIKQQILSSSV